MTQTTTTITVDSLPTANSIDPVQDILPIYKASATDLEGISRNVYLGLSSQPVGISDSQTLSTKVLDNTNSITVKDANLTIQDDSDVTKQAKFQVSGISTATTRTYTLPDTSDTLVTLAATQTLTNKTLTAPVVSGGSIDNTAITVDTISGHTTANSGTVYGISIVSSAIQGSSSLANGIVLPQTLQSGTGSSWAWQSWTPTWTNVTISNATVVARYIQIGKQVIARISVVWGGSTSASGNVMFSLPVTAASYAGTANVGYIGYGTAYDVSASTVYDTNVTLINSTTAAVTAKAANGTWVTNSSLSNTAPATWASPDEWNWTLIYEAA